MLEFQSNLGLDFVSGLLVSGIHPPASDVAGYEIFPPTENPAHTIALAIRHISHYLYGYRIDCFRSNLNSLLCVETLSLGKVISSLVRKQPQRSSMTRPLNRKIAVEVCVAKRPQFDFVTLEACLTAQLRRESARDRTPSMPWLNRANIQRWAPVREDHDLDVRLFKLCNLRIEPGKIALMHLIVHVDVPIIGVEKVIESEANRHLIFGRDERKEAAA